MNLEKLTEKEKLEELGYTPKETFLKMNQLLTNTLSDIIQKGENSDEDTYIQGALSNLAMLLAAIRGRYERNGIEFEEKDVFSYEELQKMFQNNDKMGEAYKLGLNGAQIEMIATSAASSILQGIETMLSSIPKYDPKHKSKELDKSVREILKEVKRYAETGIELGGILIGMEMERKGHLIKSEMEKLTKTEHLIKKIKRENIDKVLRPVIDMHAGIYNLPFNGNSYAFLEESGDKIDWIMTLAKMITEIKEVLTESQAAGRKTFLGATIDGQAYVHEDAESVNQFVKEKGLVSFLSESIVQDEDFKKLTDDIRSPFPDLEGKLNALGVGYELAKKISEYISINMLSRGVTGFKSVEEKDVYKILSKKIDTEDSYGKDEHSTAMKLLIERISGKKIPDFAFDSFKKEETPRSNGISGRILVTEQKKNGKSKLIYEEQKNRNLEELLEMTKAQFGKKEHEVLVTENVGVCITFDFLMGYTLTSKFKGLIEVQNEYEDLSKADKLADIIYRNQVIAHEVTHASQINSRLIWRNMVVKVAENIAETVLKWHKQGKLDYELPEGRNCFEKQTYRREMVKFLEQAAAQALGVGEAAESFRQKGLFDAVIEQGAKLREDGSFDQGHFTKVGLEKSRSAELLTGIKEAIEKNDMKLLRKLKDEAEEYGEELSTMVETMAETFGIIATQDFIRNYPDELSEERKKEYSKSIEKGIISLGLRGDDFVKIASKYEEPNESMEKELNKKGLTYRRVLTKQKDQEPVKARLIELGYNPLHTDQAYDNMQELKKRIKEHNKTSENKIGLKDVFYPLNSGRAQLDIRYRKNIPMYMKVVEKYGPQKAHELMLNAESLKDIEMTLKEGA